MESKNSILHTLLVAWKSYCISFKNYTNHPHSARLNDENWVTFYYDGKKYKLTLEEIKE